MTTIINTPPSEGKKEVVESDTGWAVAVIILIAIIAAGIYLWFHNYYVPSNESGTPPTGTTINVTVPSAPAPGTQGTSANSTNQ